nr:MAG TPA: hypothetical protein [Caudoviricetes sp.]
MAVFSFYLAAPPFLKGIANIDILKFTIQIYISNAVATAQVNN